MIINGEYQIGKVTKNKRVIAYLLRKNLYWTRLMYNGKLYMMTFDNFYQVN